MKRFHVLIVATFFYILGGVFLYFHVEIDPEQNLKLERGMVRVFEYEANQKMLRIQLENNRTVFHGRYMHHRRDQVRLIKKGDIVNIWSQERKGFPVGLFSSDSRLILKLQHQNLVLLDYKESLRLAKNKVKTANYSGWGMIIFGLIFTVLLFNPEWMIAIQKWIAKRSDLTSKG